MKKLLNESSEIENDGVLAKKSETPPQVLKGLAEKHHDNSNITKDLVSNPSTPYENLYKLAKKDSEHENLFWENPITPLMQLETPDDFAEKMGEIHRYRHYTDHNNSSHPKTFKAALRGTHRNPEVCDSLINDERITPNDIDGIAKYNNDPHAMYYVANSNKASKDTLDYIMQRVSDKADKGNYHSNIFRALFKNQNTSPETLHSGLKRELNSVDPYESNITDILYHRNMTQDMLHNYAKDPEFAEIHDMIADHWSAHPDTLDLLSNHKNGYIRTKVALNNKTSINTLEKLANDADPQVRVRARSKLPKA